MAINYNKYINSTGTHYISNSGGDERGKIYGGAAGDQTGKEWQLRAWYNRPWSVVLRYPDAKVRQLIAEYGIQAALNNKIGYDQHQRTTYWAQLEKVNYIPSNIKTACEADCTAGVTANVKAVGYTLDIPALKSLSTNIYSGNMRSAFTKAGFKALTDAKYLKGYNYLLPGDILLKEGKHACTNITKGKYAKDTSIPASRDYELGDRILKNGMSGDDVKELQNILIMLGYSCGSYGADGDFGDATELAVRKFQNQHKCVVDGEVGPITLAALKEAQAEETDLPQQVQIVGGNCYVRSEPNVSGKVLGVAREGTLYEYSKQVADNGWYKIVYSGENGWVSGKYSRLVE